MSHALYSIISMALAFCVRGPHALALVTPSPRASDLLDLRECSGCETTHEGHELDPKGRCGTCADHRLCDECGEHYTAADGPCPCHAERSALAEARRDDDRQAFDAACCALCGAPGAEPIPEPKIVDPYLREHLTQGTTRHQRRVLAAGTLVCSDCGAGVFFLPSEAA